MNRIMTPTLALILAGGLAAGIGLARPSNTTPDAERATAVEQAPATSDGSSRRQGTRTASRGGPPPEEAVAEPSALAVPEPEAAITIEDFAFAAPQSVAAGADVAVNNLDSAAHTMTFRSGGIDTGTLTGGSSTTVQAPATAGTYDFFCAIHPSMEGRITVTG